MRKISAIAMFIAVAAMTFTSCSKDGLKEKSSNTTVLHISAISNSTKTVFGEKDEDAYSTLWTTDKQVRFSANDTKDPVDVTPTLVSGGASATFKPEFTGLAESGTIYAFSPVGVYSSDVKVPGFTSFTSVDSQDAIYLNIPSVQTPLASSVDQSAQALVASESYSASSTDISMTFSHLLAYGKMTITNFSGTIKSIALVFPEEINGTSCKYAYKTGNLSNLSGSTITLDPTNVVDNIFWFSLAPTAGDALNMQIIITDNDNDTYKKTIDLTKKALPFIAGQVSSFTANFSGVTKDFMAGTDVITSADLAATSTTYTNFSNVTKNTKAVYAGNSGKNANAAIQFRTTNSNSGIVTTATSGYVQSISVKWGTGTTSGRTIDIYGKNTPYSTASDLYSSSSTQGTKLGSIVCGTSTELAISGGYKYIGIRSNSGALYLDSISIIWDTTEPIPTCATPTVNPDAGEIVGGNTVALDCTTDGAQIYYTTDNSEPSTSSTLYSSPITINEDMTIKAIAVATGYKNSAIGVFEYTLTRCATPTSSVSSGPVTAGSTVSLSCSTTGSTIYYSTDGTTPTTSSTQYTSPITINAETTIKAIAYATNYNPSEIAEYTYTISAGGETVLLFSESFGKNTGSARAWDDSYKSQKGISTVYSGASYNIINAKQSKYTVGSTESGLVQTTTGTNAEFIVGPLNVSAYSDLSLSYQWKAASISKTYSTSIYYKTSSDEEYTNIAHSAKGATSFVEVSVNLPAAAVKSTLYLKIVFNTSNTGAVIDEVVLKGKN